MNALHQAATHAASTSTSTTAAAAAEMPRCVGGDDALERLLDVAQRREAHAQPAQVIRQPAQRHELRDGNNGLAPSSPSSLSAPAKPTPKPATPLPLRPLLLLLPATGAEVLAAETAAPSSSRRRRRKVTERTRFRSMMPLHASASAWNVVGAYLS